MYCFQIAEHRVPIVEAYYALWLTAFVEIALEDCYIANLIVEEAKQPFLCV